MPTTSAEFGGSCNDYHFVSKEWLLAELRTNTKNLVVLDCRSSNEYGEFHIRGAVNFSIPSIMLRRLAAGKIELSSTIKCRELKSKICAAYADNLFVLYTDSSTVQQHMADSTVNVLVRRLTQDGCRVVCLEDGFSRFKAAFPEWCDSCDLDANNATLSQGGADPLPLMGLRSLSITTVPSHTNRALSHRSYDSLSSAANSSTDSSDTDDRCDSSLGMDDDKEFPVKILPYLYLGNAANSEDHEALKHHNITYIMNVTPDLPNVFTDGSIKYMQIPIADHWSQNLASYFAEAIDFIDEARNNQTGVLVHCLAGISRSVTITMAYLMKKCSLNLNDAFNFVRDRKANIAPNFHFMEQLHNYEKILKLDVCSQSLDALVKQIEKDHPPTHLNRKVRPSSQHNLRSAAGHHNRSKLLRSHRGLARCPNCGLAEDCKCIEHSEFLSPLATIGVSPDSGIEFDRWASSSSNNTPAE